MSINAPSSFVLESIRVSNYKSIDELHLDLNNINVFIGRNASGKSNLVDIFRFLKDVIQDGIQPAVMQHGGTLGIQNILLNKKKTSISLFGTFNPNYPIKGMPKKSMEFHYELNFQTLKTKKEVRITKERLRLFDPSSKKKEFEFNRNSQGKVSYQNKEIRGMELPKNISFLQVPFDPTLLVFRQAIENIAIFDFNIQWMKEATPIEHTTVLEEDGSNLASVIRSILNDDKKKKKFLHYLNYVLGYITDIGTQNILGSSHILTVKEKYSKEYFVTAPALSEGTLNIIGIIVAIKFQNASIIILEEPERFVHPSVLKKITAILYEEQENKQFLITTHSPELIENTFPENVILVDRDESGSTTVHHPTNNRMVVQFIEDGFTLADLMVDNTL
ncbi:MAG: hypothetical protein D6732_26545 [Methanobacteriota archaeon]|nr:MAG: hypothetical protein D6732_26545 [Euryarchaeota archaeon]